MKTDAKPSPRRRSTEVTAANLVKREELRLAEIDLMQQTERVAEMRRHLPEVAQLRDYDPKEGPEDLNSGDSPIRTGRLTQPPPPPPALKIAPHRSSGGTILSPLPVAPAPAGPRRWL